MNRVTSALDGWSAPDPGQELLRQDFLAHARTYELPDDRDCLPDHVTASALVVSSTDDAVLLCWHRKVDLWLQFGGHVERGDASLADAALREAREESGLLDLTLRSPVPTRLDRHGAPCSAKARHHLDVQFTAVVAGQPTPTVSEESYDVRWFPANQLPDLTDDAVRTLVAASLS